MKKVPIGSKPVHANRSANPDDWVLDREATAEEIKRLTIDVPVSLHKRVKSQCALRNVRMADIIREMLEKEFPGSEPLDDIRSSLPRREA